MGRSAAAVALGAAALWTAAVLWPALAAAGTLLGAADGAAVPGEAMGPVLARTAGYAAAVTVLAAALGWAPGIVLGRCAGSRGRVLAAALALLPLLVPPYVVFYTWWTAWPPDSGFFAWLQSRDLVPEARAATLVGALACWSWPLVAWCVAPGAAAVPRARGDLLRLDGARWPALLRDRLRCDGHGLALGAALVFLVTFNNTTAFDLAQVFSVGNELRAREAVGAGAREVLLDAAPAFAVTAAGLVGAVAFAARRRRPPGRESGSAGAAATGIAAGVWLLTVAAPVALLLAALGGLVARASGDGGGALGQFARFHGAALGRTLGLAAISGGLVGLVTLGLMVAWADERRGWRGIAAVQAAGWLLAALVPATVVAVALEAAWNRGLPLVPFGIAGDAGATVSDVVYRRPVIIVLGHLARCGVVGALFAAWAVRGEPRGITDLRRLDGADTLGGRWRTGGPRWRGAVVAAAAVAAVLAAGEIAVTARVAPPGSDPLAPALLNAMHFQRPLTVIAAVLVLLALGAIAAIGAAALWAAESVRARRAAGAILVAAGLGLAGCARHDAGEVRPLRPELTFGAIGTAAGQFSYPRAIAVDPQRRLVYVVDKTARVQAFDEEGLPLRQWAMPEKANGKPTGVSVAPDGRIFVADTHYHRIIAYDPEGREVLRFGAYGEGPGQFIYPTDVAFGPGGRLYVAEYGGNDRVQVFDDAGRYLFEFGAFGSGAGRFDRPQALLWDDGAGELYIADACNHRIVVTDAEGRWRRTLGRPGTGAGEMQYPYGLALLEDGTLLVSEFGNDRVQRLARDGAGAGLLGGPGAGPGRLRYPWGVARIGGDVFVLDSGNNRVHRIAAPG